MPPGEGWGARTLRGAGSVGEGTRFQHLLASLNGVRLKEVLKLSPSSSS